MSRIKTYIGGTGKVGQVVQTVKTDVFSTTSTSFVDVTGLTRAITPTATSSKILVDVRLAVSSTDNSISSKLFRGSTQIALGDAASNRSRSFGASAYSGGIGDTQQMPYNTMFLDSPNTTSETTYKCQMWMENTSDLHINRARTYTDQNTYTTAVSTLTLYEIQG